MPAVRKHPPRALLLWPLVMTFFLDVSGGPYGLEELMKSGPGMAILLILVTPIIWAAPAALMTAELASAIPAEGGYYVWVKRTMGPFWSFVCGWWTWVYSWVDVAIYPVLFATYTASLMGLLRHGSISFEDQPWLKWAIGMIVIIPFTWLNVRGVKIVGRTAVLFALLIIAPFVAMFIWGLPGFLVHPAEAVTPMIPPQQSLGQAFNSGLFVVMWNYLGWDSLSTVAEEVNEPQKTYPRALAICVPLVAIIYLLPSLVGLVAFHNYASWDDGTWATVAQNIGGPLLAIIVTAVGLVSAAGLFMATLLGASRIPFVLAEDNYLPKAITKLHPKYGTPWVAILVSAVFYTFLSFQSFKGLAILDVIVYSCAILIEFMALVLLRYREPLLDRPFRIPGGKTVVLLVALAPALVVSFAIYNQIHEEGMSAFWLSIIALATGPLVYLIARFAGRSKPDEVTS